MTRTAWTLYGFANTYRRAKDPKLLKTAERVADYVIAELSEDGIPFDKGVIYHNRDSSAAAIVAGGLLQLAKLTQDQENSQIYRTQAAQAQRVSRSLNHRYVTPTYRGDTTPPGVLRP